MLLLRKKKKGNKQMRKIKRGQIYYATLNDGVGSEQGGTRPVLIIQNDVGNAHSPTTIIAIVTSRKTKANLPTHHWLNVDFLLMKSMVELEQIRTIDKSRLGEYLGQVSNLEMAEIDRKIKISLGV